ncbi:HAD-IA family hydrolase [Ruegeria arenilitoris]|uniref:HAD-IA family hydrolase n=1 Tax=Ruegeria arenilitoris TaxID=1173585 RepID=UPI0014799E3F|nr:HAD-IA family hydrolase [Ruegeria arenilitoris]
MLHLASDIPRRIDQIDLDNLCPLQKLLHIGNFALSTNPQYSIMESKTDECETTLTSKYNRRKKMRTSSSEEVLNRVDDYDFLSLDIFDTLLFRHCKSPIDVFGFMSEHSHTRQVTEFFQDYRVAAENLARDDANEKNLEDVSLEEIYLCFQQLTNCTDAQAEQIKQLELETEMDLLHATSFGRKLVEKLQSTEKRFVITSDMYLPQEYLERVLQAKGITGWERVFVSNEQGRTKHTGRLFEDVAAFFGVSKDKVLHIGDNRHADGTMAANAGMQSRVVLASKDLPSRSPKPKRHSKLLTGTRPISQVFVANYLESHHYDTERLDFRSLSEDQYFEAFGAVMVAPLITSMLIWMKQEMDKRSISRIAFLARDGMFPKAAFELLWQAGIDTQYLAASRRLLTLPFTTLEPETLGGMLHTTLANSETLNELITKISGGPVLKEHFAKHGLDINERLSRKTRKKALKTLMEDPESFCKSFEHERSVLTQYYRSAFPAGTKSAIFDVGWRGSLQRSICAITDSEAHVFGLFFGTSQHATSILRRGGLEYVSYTVSNGQPSHLAPWFDDFRDIIEFICSADHGSILRLHKNDCGEVLWDTSEVSDLEAENFRQAKTIQDAALKAIESVLQAMPVQILAKYVDPKDERDMRNFLSDPHHEDALRFKNIRVFDGVGDTLGESLTGIGQRGTHYRNAKNSRWRAAYAAQLNPLSYSVLKFILRKRKKIRL